MLRFILGIILGAAIAFGYVRYEWALPDALQLADRLRGNLISTAVESDLYGLDRDAATQRRALEIYFANRAIDAAKADHDAGHPFLKALHRERARREARQLAAQDAAASEVLARPALREAMERKFNSRDTDILKRSMQFDALERFPFLKAWLEKNHGSVTAERLPELLRTAARAD